jgi:hypothetical protein
LNALKGKTVDDDRQLNFQQDYRSCVAGCYNRYVHVLVIYAIGIPAMCIYIGHIDDSLMGMVHNLGHRPSLKHLRLVLARRDHAPASKKCAAGRHLQSAYPEPS